MISLVLITMLLRRYSIVPGIYYGEPCVVVKPTDAKITYPPPYVPYYTMKLVRVGHSPCEDLCYYGVDVAGRTVKNFARVVRECSGSNRRRLILK